MLVTLMGQSIKARVHDPAPAVNQSNWKRTAVSVMLTGQNMAVMPSSAIACLYAAYACGRPAHRGSKPQQVPGSATQLGPPLPDAAP